MILFFAIRETAMAAQPKLCGKFMWHRWYVPTTAKKPTRAWDKVEKPKLKMVIFCVFSPENFANSLALPAIFMG